MKVGGGLGWRGGRLSPTGRLRARVALCAPRNDNLENCPCGVARHPSRNDNLGVGIVELIALEGRETASSFVSLNRYSAEPRSIQVLPILMAA